MSLDTLKTNVFIFIFPLASLQSPPGQSHPSLCMCDCYRISRKPRRAVWETRQFSNNLAFSLSPLVSFPRYYLSSISSLFLNLFLSTYFIPMFYGRLFFFPFYWFSHSGMVFPPFFFFIPFSSLPLLSFSFILSLIYLYYLLIYFYLFCAYKKLTAICAVPLIFIKHNV